MDSTKRLPTLRTTAVVIGGGIAGSWAAYKLVCRGVPTILISYHQQDRGGVQGASVRSVGAINLSALSSEDFCAAFEALGRGQANPSVAPLLANCLAGELDALRTFTELEKIELGCRLKGCDAPTLLSRLQGEFKARGGRVIDGWVTRVVADVDACRGLQYQSGDDVGKIMCRHLVIATGGYVGLFADSLHTGCNGTILGHFMRCGGIAANLEFLFKHGFGKPDMGQLSPTEELRGAEIQDGTGENVRWIERELYIGNGTHIHQQAVSFWRQNRQRKFFVNLRHRGLFQHLRTFNLLVESASQDAAQLSSCQRTITDLFPADTHAAVEGYVAAAIGDRRAIGYEEFCDLRALLNSSTLDNRWQRICHIPYFTMGGVAHVRFKTSCRNVYVTGEAMHAFGANRVGGLPWALYLVAGESIAQQIAGADARDPVTYGGFKARGSRAAFDQDTLKTIRGALHEHQQSSCTRESSRRGAAIMRTMRRDLRTRGRDNDDAISWLIVAEAIFLSSMLRAESRGCFIRDDMPGEDEALEGVYTMCSYQPRSDTVKAFMATRPQYIGLVDGEEVPGTSPNRPR